MPRLVANPPNPWEPTHVENLGAPPPATLTVHEEDARTIIASNHSPDVPFRDSVNPYRGCFHGCACGYARPSHDQATTKPRPSHDQQGFGAGALVECDADVLAALARDARCTVLLRIPFADETQPRAIEPCASSLARRFGAAGHTTRS